MKIEIAPKYLHLKDWIMNLPRTFFEQGEIIYDARNQIRIIKGPDGEDYCVKRFCQPHLLNRIAYSLVRTTKAQRAYENAIYLQEKGVSTPSPIAYILCGGRLLKESFLITKQLSNQHMLYQWGDGKVEGREEAIRSLARFAATMHEAGILHLDFSPGNLLYEEKDGKYSWNVVDINRMAFRKVDLQEGCQNFARLWGAEPLYRILASEYAKARNADEIECFQTMWSAHIAFWKNRKKPKADFDLVPFI